MLGILFSNLCMPGKRFGWYTLLVCRMVCIYSRRLRHIPYWTKFRRTKYFVGKIFDTKPKFRQFCPIFAWLLYWNIGQIFQRTKWFVGQNFRHQAKISTLLSDEFLSDIVSHIVPFLRYFWGNASAILTITQQKSMVFTNADINRLFYHVKHPEKSHDQLMRSQNLLCVEL